jgi:hypothetical protein
LLQLVPGGSPAGGVSFTHRVIADAFAVPRVKAPTSTTANTASRLFIAPPLLDVVGPNEAAGGASFMGVPSLQKCAWQAPDFLLIKI